VGSNCLALAAVVSSDTSPATAPTNFSGNGLTWERILTTNFNTVAAPIHNLTVYAAMSNNVSAVDAGTVSFVNSRSGCSIYICEFTNVWFADGVLGAIVQRNAVSGTTADPSNVLSALPADGRNAVVAFFGSNSNPFGGTPEAGWTEDEDTGYGSPTTGIGVYHRLQTTDNGLVVSQSASDWASVKLELRSLPPTVIGGNVSLIKSGATGTFDTKNVGTDKLVTVSGLALGGSDATNFTLTPQTTSANITPVAITVTAVTDTKVYDGTTSSDGEPTIVPALIAPDAENFSQSFDNQSAGTGKTLTPAGSVNDGNGGHNYSVTFANATTGEITALAVGGDFTASNKTYDGTTAATVLTRGLIGVLPTDAANVTLEGGVANFSDADTGMGKSVSLTSATLSGSAAGNYTLTSVGTATANIDKSPLTATADHKIRAFGEPNPPLTISYSGFVNEEGVGVLDSLPTASTTATISSSAGTYSITLTGGSDNNYALNLVNGTLTVTNTSRPTITSISRNGGVVVITWNAVASQTYRVQYKNSLTDSTWTDLPPDVTVTGPTASKTDNVGAQPQRFYRIQLLP